MKVLSFTVTVVVPDEVADEYVLRGLETYAEHAEEDLQEYTDCPTCTVRVEAVA